MFLDLLRYFVGFLVIILVKSWCSALWLKPGLVLVSGHGVFWLCCWFSQDVDKIPFPCKSKESSTLEPVGDTLIQISVEWLQQERAMES